MQSKVLKTTTYIEVEASDRIIKLEHEYDSASGNMRLSGVGFMQGIDTDLKDIESEYRLTKFVNVVIDTLKASEVNITNEIIDDIIWSYVTLVDEDVILDKW